MTQLIDLGKLRFHFAGDWLSSTTYETNDIVKYGGNVYVYTNPVKTMGNLPTDTQYWVLMVEGFKFKGNFVIGTQYRVGDGIAYGGKVYIAVKDSQAQVPPNATYWSQFADGIQWEGPYSGTNTYQKNDVVTYGGQAYIAIQDSVNNLPTNTSYWQKFVSGVSPEGVYNNSVAYAPGAIVAYGANLYRCKLETTGNIPTSTLYWDLFTRGNDFQGNWTAVNNYLVGQTVRFGGNIYQAIANNTNSEPSSQPQNWVLYYSGINARGAWTATTYYGVNDVVSYGGNTFICAVSHTSSSNFNTELNALPTAKWTKYNSGIRYMGAWTTGTTYLKDDIVSNSVSTYICLTDHAATSDFFQDLAANKWTTFVVGAAYVLPATANKNGRYLQTPDGQNYSWEFANANDNIYYVAEDSISSADDVNHGATVDYAFASLKYACQFIAASPSTRSPATIFVKDGVYNEQLPIIVPENVTIVGDGQRNTIIQPKSGLSDDGITPNNQTTMFFLSSGVMIEGLLMKGLTGFVKSTINPEDLNTATIKGVYCRLNPNSMITKSPYVKESSAFSTGGVGAIVDGSVGPVGSGGSMVFHTFTQVHDGGVGFWVKERGLSEIVSCFTYYCDFGLAATGGGKIRSLNCNNSYGTYGSMASGYDANENVLTGTMYGDTLMYDPSTLSSSPGFMVGQSLTQTNPANLTVTGMTIAAQAVITTSTNHGLYDGQPISFTGVAQTIWQSILGDQAQGVRKTWYADVLTPTTFKLCSNFDLTNYFDNRSIGGWGIANLTITDALRSNPVILQINSHGFTNGERISDITGILGQTQLNGNSYYVTVLDTNRVSLYTDAGRTISVDGTTMGNYISGGTATRTLVGTTLTSATVTIAKPRATITNIQTNLGTAYHRLVVSDIKLGNTGHTYKVNTKTVNAAKGFYLNGTKSLSFTAYTTRQYVFEQNDTTNVGEALYFTTSPGGTTPYATGVTYWLNNIQVADRAAYIAGFAAATGREVKIQVDAALAGTTLYYKSSGTATGGSLSIVSHSNTAYDRFTGETIYPFLDGSTIIANGTITATLVGTNAHMGQYGFALVLGGLNASPIAGGSIEFVEGPTYSPADNADITEPLNTGADSRSYIITSVSGWDAINGTATITLSQEKLDTADAYYGQHFNIRYNYSQVRLTGHDFLSIGTGGRATTNYPGVPTQAASQGNEVVENLPGRVYFVSTDQDGNFRIGNYFRVDQATGRATLDASAFDLSGLTSLRLGSIGAQIGESINEFSSDPSLSGASNIAVPTEYAVKTYVDNRIDSISQDQLVLTNLVSSNKTLATGRLTFSMDVLTLSGANTVYTIAPSAYHFVLNPNGFALFN